MTVRTIAIMPGRFHPFHKGHAASFKQLAGKFGIPNTLLAISAKQEQPNSPFAAADRAKMAQALGIPAKNILIVRNPYNSLEYADHLQSKGIDPTKTALVFGVSGKDMNEDPRFSFKPTKNGKPSYMQPFTKEATLNLQPMTKGTPGTGHAYVMTTDVEEFPVAGKVMRDASAIRKAYAGADEKTKMRILGDLYGDAGNSMKQLFDNNLQITESVKALVNKIKPLLGEATDEQKEKFVELLSEAKESLKTTNPCWNGYKPVGTKKKNGKTVPNCVPDENVDEAANAAQQSAIAINMKKHHKKPKNEDVMESLGDDFYLINGTDIRYIPESHDLELRDVGKIVSDDEFEDFYNHPEFHKTAEYARQHYPSAPSKQQAFLRFVMNSLRHSKEDDEKQDKDIDLLMTRVNSLDNKVEKLSKNVSESSFDWSDYKFIENMDTRLDVVTSHFNHKMNLTEANDPDMTDYFLKLKNMSDNVSVDEKCIVVDLVLLNNKVGQIQFPEIGTLLKVDNGIYHIKRASGVIDTYPKGVDRGKVSFITLLFNKISSYEKLRNIIMLKFDSPLPDPVLFIDSKTNTQKSEKVDESLDYLEEK